MCNDREIIEEVKELVISEIRQLNLAKNNVWRFQNYNAFRTENLNAHQKYYFEIAVDELCASGILKKEKDGTVYLYRLTEEGEKIVYYRKL